MEMRELKALELAARAKIVHGDDGIWSVPSQTAGRVYRVVTWPGAETCECEDFQLRQLPCKHIIAAKLVEEREGKRPAPPMDTDTPPERKTYSQNWPAYNLAQTTEKHRLQELLADLCRGVPEPAYAGTGRRSVPMADRLFAMTFKVYCLMSHRRFGCDLSDAHDRGYLTRILHPSKVSSFLCDPELTPILHELIARSAAPLKAVETKFAVDSSGFSACKFGRWFDAKYGIDRWEREWVKVHACTGVKTGVTTAIRVTGKDGGDCPQFLPLVADTGKGFTVKEVSADKAYLSTENVDLVAALGGECFIPPKSNTTGGVGGLFAKMVGYYQFRRDEFLQHYHSRSNVESLFSAVKRKFGDWVRCRNEAGMVNEVLCKFLCNNLCCVILSQIELGIDAEFWKGKDDGARDVLPLVRRG
jgi:transposase